jgi:hypothetical protein
MFQQEQSHDATASSQPETGEELQTLLQREEIVDLKQYIDTEANAAAEARLSELMKALDENGDGQVSLTEFTEHATEENLSKLVTDGVITEGEKSKISQDRRHHQVIGSRGDSLHNQQKEEAAYADTSITNEPDPQAKASMEDILAAMSVAVGAHDDTPQLDIETKQEIPLEDQEIRPLDSHQELHPETLKTQADLEALRAIRDEISHKSEEYLEVEATQGQVEAIEAVESSFLSAEPEQTLAEEVEVGSKKLSDALSHSLEQLEMISAEINADLQNKEPVPFESIGTDEDILVVHETEKLVHEPTAAVTETLASLSSEHTTPHVEQSTIATDGEPLNPEVESVPTALHAERLDQEKSQENSLERESARFKGRKGDLIFSL